jgi:hypothetical protein
LTARFSVKGRVIEDDFPVFAGLQSIDTLAILNDGQNFAVFGPRLEVAFEN